MPIYGYYNRVRHDILAHVPSDIRRVLSVGCGDGCTEAKLVARGVEVTAIELNPESAKAATGAGVKVVCGDALNIDLASEEVPFDCLIYADVLEHIPDPKRVLCKHAKLVRESGTVIVSVPNFRHYSVFWQLFVGGRIRYTDGGLLDRTHIRITTRRMVEEWFRDAGLVTDRVEYRIGGRRYQLLSALTFGLLREFIAFQVIVVGRRK